MKSHVNHKETVILHGVCARPQWHSDLNDWIILILLVLMADSVPFRSKKTIIVSNVFFLKQFGSKLVR